MSVLAKEFFERETSLRVDTSLTFAPDEENMRDVVLVGTYEAVRGAAEKMQEQDGAAPALAAVEAMSKSPTDKGKVEEVLYASAGGKLRRLVLAVTFPPKEGRHMPSCRPDLVVAQLMGKLAGKDVWICGSSEDQAVLAVAIARCAPAFSMKDCKEPAAATKVTFLGGLEKPKTAPGVQRTLSAVRMAQYLVDAPPCQLSPAAFEEFARAAAAGLPHTTVESIVGEELRTRGYHGIWSVGKAAEEAPRLVILRHEPPSASGPGVALVGKGITYDTGGLAIKNTEGMCGMKRDMGGAAGMLGAFVAAAAAERGERLYCVLCIAENAVAAAALRNDDVIRMYSGLTVEVNNTDAEGRLVLGDGAAHVAKHLDVHTVVDMATLTGAQGIATGQHHGLLVASNAELEREMVDAAYHTGDLIHPMFFMPEVHLADFDSQIADMKNLQKTRLNASSSSAGIFVWRHLTQAGFKGRWCHVDMAYPSFTGERATGYGAALLSRFLGAF